MLKTNIYYLQLSIELKLSKNVYFDEYNKDEDAYCV